MVQEEQLLMFVGACVSLVLSHTLLSWNLRALRPVFVCVLQDFGSLSNLQVTQPTVGMNFRTPRGV